VVTRCETESNWDAKMLILVKYVGAHEGRTVLAVKCSNGEIIPLICDAAEEEAEYQMLCQTAIRSVAVDRHAGGASTTRCTGYRYPDRTRPISQAMIKLVLRNASLNIAEAIP